MALPRVVRDEGTNFATRIAAAVLATEPTAGTDTGSLWAYMCHTATALTVPIYAEGISPAAVAVCDSLVAHSGTADPLRAAEVVVTSQTSAATPETRLLGMLAYRRWR